MKFIKFTLISELPEPYRSLALLRETQPQCRISNGIRRELLHAFIWTRTPEGHKFWEALCEGNLPPIPESSLAELKADA